MNSTLALAAILSFASPAAEAPAAKVALEFECPAKVAVGEAIDLEVRVTNRDAKDFVVRVPELDAKSFEFKVKFGDGTESTYTAFHPMVGVASTLQGADFKQGETLKFAHSVPALKAGKWTFKAVYRGTPGAPIESEAKTVTVEPKDGNTDLRTRIESDAGTILLGFWPETAPATCLHIAGLVRKGYYDGLKFHRAIDGFMIQGGCPKGDGTGNPGYSIKAETSKRKHLRGVWSMARSSHLDSAGSQFFICDDTASNLDGGYTAFGEVIDGNDTVRKIATAPASMGRDGAKSVPVQPVVMTKVTLELGK